MNKVLYLSQPPGYSFVEGWYDIAEPDHFWMEWRFLAFWRQIRDLGLPTGSPWKGLDIGCGAGVVCGQIEEKTRWDLDGTDLDKQALSRHPDRRGRTLLYDIFDRRPELAERYDFILLFDILEHIPDTKRFLEASLFHLKRDGWLFVNVPAFQCLSSTYDRAAGHLRRYDRNMMSIELGRHPLEIKDMRYWGASMIPLVLLRKVLLSRGAPAPETVRKGFQPPGKAANAVLKALMRVETALGYKPLAGSSLLAAAVKG